MMVQKTREQNGGKDMKSRYEERLLCHGVTVWSLWHVKEYTLYNYNILRSNEKVA